MSITHYKALIWTGALAVAGYLGWYVFNFFEHKQELELAVSKETQEKVLTSIPPVEPEKDDVVDYELVKRTWHGMDWTGKPPAKPVEVANNGEPAKPQVKAVATLLKVLLVQVDGGQPELSMAHVSFTDQTLKSANPNPDDQILKEGEKLDHPYDPIEVAKIARDGVHFRFLGADGQPDAGREEELVETSRIVGTEDIVHVGPDGVIVPSRPTIPTATQSRPRTVPRETTLIGDDHYLAGLDDREIFARDYTKLLAEMRFGRHYDPKTGKPDGVEIKDVPKDSFGAKYGAKAGQVIKSINGHPITSVNEGISYAKQNADKYKIWTIVYEEQGKEKTKIIDTSDS
jgi:hypothetical protein